MNAATELLDKSVTGDGERRVCLRTLTQAWSYGELLEKTNRVASVLVRDLGMQPGNRVLLRGFNNPMFAACFLAVLKAGGIAVPTMPLLRARELSYALDKAKVQFAICDARLAGELDRACAANSAVKTIYFGDDVSGSLESRMARHGAGFDAFIASHDDVALIAFTSGTTAAAKATMHFHRDLLAICDCFPEPMLQPAPDDVFAGSAPFAFTFGLGALLLFPLRFGASSVLLEQPSAETLLQAMQQHHATILFTVPTLYRAMTPLVPQRDLSSLRACISSGEHLPISVYEAWLNATGLRLINSIGSTEMLHAFLAMPPRDTRPGAIGKPLPGFRAIVADDEMHPLPPGRIGRLAVRGPVGCRYLDDLERQTAYVRQGWNLTGDAVHADDDGFFWYHARTDDLIVSAGYNISGAEVEGVLLSHPAVKECAVVGIVDDERGQLVTAFIVLHEAGQGGPSLTDALQELVKASLAPYKYPRRVEYLPELPKTVSGKIQRAVLRSRDRTPV
jgi:2-aminobenzoate-CoA ligase